VGRVAKKYMSGDEEQGERQGEPQAPRSGKGLGHANGVAAVGPRIALLISLAMLLSGCIAMSTPVSCQLPSASTTCDAKGLGAVANLVSEDDRRDEDYTRKLEALLASDRIGRIDRRNGTGPFGRSIHDVQNRDLVAEYRALTKLATESSDEHLFAGSGPNNKRTMSIFQGKWRMARSTLYVDGSSAVASPAFFQFSGLQAKAAEIHVMQIGADPLQLAGACDGAMAVEQAGGRSIYRAGQRITLRLGAATDRGTTVTLSPDEATSRCDFTQRSRAGTRAITILREETADPELAAFDSRFERCAVPDSAGLDALETAFYASRWLSETCPAPLGKPIMLPEERQGFDAKVAALLGTPLPAGFYDLGDPELPLDFSRAPHLDLIYFSYLDFKADFSGRVMERLIRHHAAAGAKVRMMVTSILEREKDIALLRGLASDFPNVQLQEYTWDAAGGSPLDEVLSEFHKTHHVKMLATRAREAGRSRAIIGGRNIHDGFLFLKPLDLSRYPNLQQYGKTDGLSLNYYSNWNDLDMEIRDPAAVEDLLAHIATLWHRDADTNLSRPYSVPAAIRAKPSGNMRHFISVPYADGMALEDYYVELFDAASKTIEIVNPYLNPTPAIGAAIDRALDRGVKITIVGRIDLKGDLGGKILTELNELFVEKYADRIEIHEFKAPGVVLHPKVLMVDGRLITFSSVNLNRRSFLHDSENGVTVLDPAFYRIMKAIFESYIDRSRPVSSEVEVPLRYRLLLSSDLLLEAL
jgi:cardiolipin synthase